MCTGRCPRKNVFAQRVSGGDKALSENCSNDEASTGIRLLVVQVKIYPVAKSRLREVWPKKKNQLQPGPVGLHGGDAALWLARGCANAKEFQAGNTHAFRLWQRG